MPSACFQCVDSLLSVSKHAKGMSLRYGVVVFDTFLYKRYSRNQWCVKKALPFVGWQGWYFGEIVGIYFRIMLMSAVTSLTFTSPSPLMSQTASG